MQMEPLCKRMRVKSTFYGLKHTRIDTSQTEEFSYNI